MKKSKVQFENAKIKNLCAKNIVAQTLSAEIAGFKTLAADNADIKNITASTINGKLVDKPICSPGFNVESNLTPLDVAQIIGSISEKILTISQQLTGQVKIGQYLLGKNVTLGTYIVGKQGDNYLLNNDHNIVNTRIDLYTKPVEKGYNSEVLTGLWDNTIFNLQDVLIPNLQCGRSRNKSISDFYNCKTCPPISYGNCEISGNATITGNIQGNILNVTSISQGKIEIGQVLISQKVENETAILQVITPNLTYRVSVSQILPESELLLVSNCPTVENICETVPMKIYGIETVVPGIWDPVCGINKVLSNLAYNLDVINRSKDLSEKVVAVLLQVAWIENGIFTLRQVNLGLKQFGPSLAAVLGEQLSANLILPTNLINRVILAMPPVVSDNSAAVQLVVYIEEGIEVFTPPVSTFKRRNVDNTNNTNVSASYAVNNSPNVIKLLKSDPSPFKIADGVKSINITAFGGGGGGGKAVLLRLGIIIADGINVPGGGGGSGYQTNILHTDVSQIGAKYLSYTIGSGGSSDKDGEDTIFSLLDENKNQIPGLSWTAKGGEKGGQGTDRVTYNQSGNGGNGEYGGGGGQTPGKGNSPAAGNGGSSKAGQLFDDGKPGNNIKGGDGGSFSADNFSCRLCVSTPGIGGTFPYSGGDGGGGGGGGGNGGGNGGSKSSPNGSPAVQNSSSGGGGASGVVTGSTGYYGDIAIYASGGNGADGYIYVSVA